jgi:hypothetical protein
LLPKITAGRIGNAAASNRPEQVRDAAPGFPKVAVRIAADTKVYIKIFAYSNKIFCLLSISSI